MYRKEISEFYRKQRTRKTLTWAETLDAVMGEDTLFTWRIFIPVYSKPDERNMDYVTKKYLAQQNESNEASDKKTD